MKLSAVCEIIYDGRLIHSYESFEASDEDGNILCNNGLARKKEQKWVGETKIKPITELRHYFGRAPRFVMLQLETEKPVEVRLGFSQARREFQESPSTETAEQYCRAAGWTWASGEIELSELQLVRVETLELLQ